MAPTKRDNVEEQDARINKLLEATKELHARTKRKLAATEEVGSPKSVDTGNVTRKGKRPAPLTGQSIDVRHT